MFIEYNANPYGVCIEDCAIRAITTATDKDYFDVMDGLIAVADSHKDWEIDELRTIHAYLVSIGWEVFELVGDKPNPTVKQYAEEVTEPRIVIVNDHATCTKNGNTYDTWNCNRYRVKCGYRKCIDK